VQHDLFLNSHGFLGGDKDVAGALLLRCGGVVGCFVLVFMLTPCCFLLNHEWTRIYTNEGSGSWAKLSPIDRSDVLQSKGM
jgi:hypothetical protein